jgi:hypothetical protein
MKAPENHGHPARSGIVSEKSFLSYYKTEFLRAAPGGVPLRPGMRGGAGAGDNGSVI